MRLRPPDSPLADGLVPLRPLAEDDLPAVAQRLAEKAGFTSEGLLRFHRELEGVRRDHVVFSLLPSHLP